VLGTAQDAEIAQLPQSVSPVEFSVRHGGLQLRKRQRRSDRRYQPGAISLIETQAINIYAVESCVGRNFEKDGLAHVHTDVRRKALNIR
jgi:hypothetical protein